MDTWNIAADAQKLVVGAQKNAVAWLVHGYNSYLQVMYSFRLGGERAWDILEA
jgi:hypothetical protein